MKGDRKGAWQDVGIVEKALMADATIPLKRMIFRGHIHNAAVIVPLGIHKL